MPAEDIRVPGHILSFQRARRRRASAANLAAPLTPTVLTAAALARFLRVPLGHRGQVKLAEFMVRREQELPRTRASTCNEFFPAGGQARGTRSGWERSRANPACDATLLGSSRHVRDGGDGIWPREGPSVSRAAASRASPATWRWPRARPVVQRRQTEESRAEFCCLGPAERRII